MNNSQESNYFIPILSAIAGIGAIVTVLSPLLFSKNLISNLFIDPSLIQYSTVIAIIISVISIWYASSNQSYEIFQVGRKVIFKLTFLFMLLAISFYVMKVLSDNHALNNSLASSLQISSYLFGYFILSLVIGVLLRESFGAYKFQKNQQERFDRVREALFKSGILRADLQILSFQQRPFNNNEPQYIGAYNIVFKTSSGKYFAIVSSDYSQLFYTEEIKEIVNKNPKK